MYRRLLWKIKKIGKINFELGAKLYVQRVFLRSFIRLNAWLNCAYVVVPSDPCVRVNKMTRKNESYNEMAPNKQTYYEDYMSFSS